MVVKEAIEVKLESPAARNADGSTKLVDQNSGWVTAEMTNIINTIGTISSGGLNILINSG